MPRPKTPIAERYWNHAIRADGCWSWAGAVDDHGYGVIGKTGARAGVAKAHRVSWEIHNGTIPDGLFVLHRCDNPPCSNPQHLFLGTQTDNMRDASRKGRTRTTPKIGSQQPGAKLNEDSVRSIRSLYATGGHTMEKLAHQFGVSKKLILLVVHRRNWTHI